MIDSHISHIKQSHKYTVSAQNFEYKCEMLFHVWINGLDKVILYSFFGSCSFIVKNSDLHLLRSLHTYAIKIVLVEHAYNLKIMEMGVA